MNTRKHLLLGALTSLAVAAAAATAFAADSASPSTNAPSHQFHGHKHGSMHGARSPFIHAVHQLNLSADQQQQIHSLLKTDREQAHAAMGASRPNPQALGNPGDPSYAAAVAAAKTSAATAIQHRSDLEVQIFGLLTPEQQASLPKVLADMKAHGEEHRAKHQQQPA